jgi:hypothetical protein
MQLGHHRGTSHEPPDRQSDRRTADPRATGSADRRHRPHPQWFQRRYVGAMGRIRSLAGSGSRPARASCLRDSVQRDGFRCRLPDRRGSRRFRRSTGGADPPAHRAAALRRIPARGPRREHLRHVAGDLDGLVFRRRGDRGRRTQTGTLPGKLRSNYRPWRIRDLDSAGSWVGWLIYGHVQKGPPETADRVGAERSTYQVAETTSEQLPSEQTW